MILSLEEALELVGLDGCTEARNGQPQPLHGGDLLTANRDGTFTVTPHKDPRCEGCEGIKECGLKVIHPECLPFSERMMWQGSWQKEMCRR